MDQAQIELDGFIDKYTREVAALTRALLAKMKARVPGAQILVYDNYNSLAIGFARSDKGSEAILSLVAMPRWVTLCLLWGKGLPDPHNLLNGEGARVRNLRLHKREDLDDPRIQALIGAALERTSWPIDATAEQRLIIKAIMVKQRARRPAARDGASSAGSAALGGEA